MITEAGGGNESNNKSLAKRIRAGGRSSILPVRAALGTSYTEDDYEARLPIANINAGDILAFSVTTSPYIQDWSYYVNLMHVEVLSRDFRVSQDIHVATIIVKALENAALTYFSFGGEAANRAIVGSKFTHLNGTSGGSLGIEYLIGTENPDTGLVALNATVPQIHYGTIGTFGQQTDADGDWQNGMVQGQKAGTAVPLNGARVKEGYRILSSAAQARAYVIGQTNRETCACVICVT